MAFGCWGTAAMTDGVGQREFHSATKRTILPQAINAELGTARSALKSEKMRDIVTAMAATRSMEASGLGAQAMVSKKAVISQ
jgi:hypothetical protein